LGCLEWLGPNHNYFSETKGHTAVFQRAQGSQRNLQQAQGLLCKVHGILTVQELFPNGKIHGPAARSGPRWTEGDEAKPLRGSPEHRRRRSGGMMTVENGGGSFTVGER
jgi:hypothetical protein